ncbi:MAG: hypothetical protein AABP62_24935 [Planctomycetota bacterium]
MSDSSSQKPKTVGDDLRQRLLNQWTPDHLGSYVEIIDILNKMLPSAPGDLQRSSMTRCGSPLIVSVDESESRVLRFTVDAMSNAPGQLTGFIDWAASILPNPVRRFLEGLRNVPGEPIECMYVGMRPTRSGVGTKLYLGRLPHAPDVVNRILMRLISAFGQLEACGARLIGLVREWRSISQGMYGIGVTVTEDGPIALDGYFFIPEGTKSFEGFLPTSNGCNLQLLESVVRSTGIVFENSHFGTAVSVDLEGNVKSFKLEFPVVDFQLPPSMPMSSCLGRLLSGDATPVPNVLSFRAGTHGSFSPIAYFPVAGLTKSASEILDPS